MSIRLLAIIIITIIFSHCDKSSYDNAQNLFKKGTQCQNTGNIYDAYVFYKQAINKEWNPLFEWAAASTAPNRYTANLHAKAAWSGGLRDKDLFIFLLKTCQFKTLDNAFAYSVDLLSQMPDSHKTGYLKGQIHFNLGDNKTALSVWKHAYQNYPDSDLASAITELFFAEGMYDSLFTFCSMAIENNLLDQSGYTLYAYALAHTGRFEEADSVLNLFKHRFNRYDFHEERAWLYYFSGNINNAIKLLESSLKKTGFRYIQKKLMLSFFYSQNSDTTNLKRMLSSNRKHTESEKQIQTFNDAMFLLSKHDTLTSEKLEDLRTFFMQNTVYHFVRARLNIHRAPHRSFESFKLLPSVITRFPDITLEYASLLRSNGDFNFALSLLTHLHNRGIYSKESLVMYRDLAFRLNFINESFETGLFLEHMFPNDNNIRLNNVQLLIKAGMLDSAARKLHELRMNHPNEPGFQTLYIQVLFMLKEYEKVLLECNASTAPLYDILAMKARALVKLNRINEADYIYQKLLSVKTDMELSAEYADFLYSSEKTEDAAALYQNIIDSCNSSEQNLKATVQNKLAKILLNSSSGDKNKALKIAFEAFQNKNNDPYIIDTYAEALRQTGKILESINLLQGAISKDRNPLLLNRLAYTLNMTDNKKIAAEIYNELLELSDSTLSNYKLSKDEIREYMRLF
ncbi:MAG TPA: hypothetical protein VKY57_10955 [Chitinispirillaceae bacterium]|nr:hypothetical protein [Chitinispirillaceae bacterium]